MNKQQRQYTAQRILSIVKSKEPKTLCEEPSLKDHIKKAIIAGTAKLKPAKAITALFRQMIESGNFYYSITANCTELFEAPATYKAALAAANAERKKHAAVNEELNRYALSLIDKIEFGKYSDGSVPIHLMETYEAQPKKKA